ncbi:MAG: hypothetical protein Q7S52_05170 [bacterium]|nr:hypothetical protein [bacterium]
MHEQTKVGWRDNLLFGIAGGLAVAAIAIFPVLFYGKNVSAPSFVESSVAVIGTLFIAAFIEYRLSKRGEWWRKVQYGMALAAALGISLICGYGEGATLGVIRFTILTPIALLSAYAAERLFAKSNKSA